MINTPDQTVIENAGPVSVCVELENPIETSFNLSFVPRDGLPDGATGVSRVLMLLRVCVTCVVFALCV